MPTACTVMMLTRHVANPPPTSAGHVRTAGETFSLSVTAPEPLLGKARGTCSGATPLGAPFLRAQILRASLCSPLKGDELLSMACAAAAADCLWGGSTCRAGVAPPIDHSSDWHTPVGALKNGGQLGLDPEGSCLGLCLLFCSPAPALTEFSCAHTILLSHFSVITCVIGHQ